ncbi:hypothetical protein [Oceanicoccus sagamiensis]|uniref:Uncharacterized protein n=1 Tax=Oceanicoccus sagamiensis TaxID=716816 RepID=A0A1X9NB73_9GAMM|nr:hypothetical protein [Oceanicoccus sagamiensis]ARN73165.1 hypothetical protein BST96_03015 [Oceanicoccus sagamiensis]
MDTLASKLSNKTLDQIVEHFDLNEVKGTAGGDFLPLVAESFGGLPVGGLRVWDGGDGPIKKMVYIGVAVDPIGMDSHMIFAFTQPDSLVPNFTLDSVFSTLPPGMDPIMPEGGETYAFHLDLLPAVDLGVNLPYMEKCFIPLTDTQSKCKEFDGIIPALLSSAQNAIMSPWMLAQRSDTDAYNGIVFESAQTYLDHWISLVDNGLDDIADKVVSTDPATREQQNRALIFSRELDPVWQKIDMMVGAETSDYMITVLRNQEIEQPR